MKAFIDMLMSAWPGVLLVGGLIGGAIGWIATKAARKKTAAADQRLIDTLEANISAQAELAKTLADSAAKKEAILLQDRADSDARHEAIIKEYRDNIHAVRGELQECAYKAGEYKAELADAKARTDFNPVMEFLKTSQIESQSIQKQTLDTLNVIAPVLREVSLVMSKFGPDKVQQVHVINTKDDRVPTETVIKPPQGA